MICEDDIPGDVSSAASLEIGASLDGSFNTDDCELDIDYIQVELEYGHLYWISANDPDDTMFPSDIAVSVTSEDGRVLPYAEADGFLDNRTGYVSLINAFRARRSGTHYIAVSNPQGERAYELAATNVSPGGGQREGGTFDDRFLQPGYAIDDLLFDEFSDNPTNTYPIRTVPGDTYEFNLFGADGGRGTIEDPRIDVRTNNMVYSDDDSGFGKNAFLRVVAEDNIAWIDVRGEDTGEFHLHIRRLDTTLTGIETQSSVPVRGAVSDFIDTPQDIDWHRVELESGQWYTVSTSAEFPLTVLLRDPDREIPEISIGQRETELTFQATKTGTHFLVARPTYADEIGQYAFRVDQVGAPLELVASEPESTQEPPFDSRPQRFEVYNGAETKLGDLIHTGDTLPISYQIYSGQPLLRNGVSQAAGQIYTVPANELPQWSQQRDGDNVHTEIMFRTELADNTQSQWIKALINNRSRNPDLEGDVVDFVEAISFTFPEEMPSSWEGTYSGFEEASFDEIGTALVPTPW